MLGEASGAKMGRRYSGLELAAACAVAAVLIGLAVNGFSGLGGVVRLVARVLQILS
jgi:hypothetical protein